MKALITIALVCSTLILVGNPKQPEPLPLTNINKQIKIGQDLKIFSLATLTISSSMLYLSGHPPFNGFGIFCFALVYLAGEYLQWEGHRALKRIELNENGIKLILF